MFIRLLTDFIMGTKHFGLLQDAYELCYATGWACVRVTKGQFEKSKNYR